MRKKNFLFAFFAFLNVLNAQSKIDDAIKNLENNYSQEKVYLLLDKNQYLNGDNILFKSFVFEGYQLSTISTTLFVELYDQNKKLLDKKTILIKNGEGTGSFTLDEKLPEDVYFIRAYTPWMANFTEAFQTFQPILVYNPDSAKKLELKENNWSAKVYPESGTFIENVSTKFAVRINNTSVGNANWSGYVIDKDHPNEKITTYKGLDENVAIFSITPENGKHYQTIIEDAKGKKQTVDLPEVATSGVSFHVNSSKNGIDYEIGGINLPENLKNYKIIGTINNRLAYKAESKEPLKEFKKTIPTNIYGSYNAVLQLTVFNENNIVVAQRLCFILPNDLNIKKPTIVGLPFSNSPRSSNEFEISDAKDFNEFTVLVKEAEAETSDENNVLSTLWLTGDFTDKIEYPAQYFSIKNNANALDALLISEKWQRFDWKTLLSGTKPFIKYKPEEHLSFRGRLAKNSAPLQNTSVNLLVQIGDKNTTISPAQTDSEGFIYLDNITYDEPLKISYFLNKNEKNKLSVPDNLTLHFQPTVNFVPLNGDLPSSKYILVDRESTDVLPPKIANAVANKKNNLQIKNDETLIQEVKIKGNKMSATDKLNDDLSRGMFNSMNSTVFDFINENQNVAGQSIMQFLQGRVAGLTFQTNQNGDLVPYIRNAPAKIYLDESPIDINFISSISVSDIAMVKIFKGSVTLGNAIAIYFRKGGMKSVNDTKEPKKNNTVTLKTYDKPVEFVEPNFNSDSYKKINSDTRNVLYWNPSLLQNPKLHTTVKFFNNDSAKSFKVTIISFNELGAPLFFDEVLK
ncbi:hypothetical protein SAMN05421847_0283 [Halpernia humi]|uniref:Macroglobulin domain-containing protein n=1 Tax=Halpernia humi TaxID=493375 RepID=A0A1H5SVZ5_9FLAO|nr:hypothetical protein [Halpernia humi]SEF54679.1 hypothetical protein SAMN05421847_0283 [Halpernia humi]